MRHLPSAILALLVFFSACAPAKSTRQTTHLDSLSQISIETLRQRDYGSTLKVEVRFADEPHETLIASYLSDGLRVYTRIDIPSSDAPASGYPVVVFVHGWMGIDAAPSTDFYMNDESSYNKMITSYVEAGFVVLTPGWRGHGTVNGIAAEGIEFMRDWDNGSYISPVYYAIDVLNLLDSMQTFTTANLDLSDINLVAHSQGGDVALIALAVSGEGSSVANPISSASIWSGCFPSRFTQLETYQPMQKSPQAFLAGDGIWNGTAVGADGRVNPDFVFGYPADWIETPNIAEWTWQKDVFTNPTVVETLNEHLAQMYNAINNQVGDINDASYEFRVQPDGSTEIIHDDRIRKAMAGVDAFYMEQYLTEPLVLQHSDRDFYSFPEWNADLCARINSDTVTCYDFEYPENTHSLQVSENRWFSSADAVAGFSTAVLRDIALFRGKNPNAIR